MNKDRLLHSLEELSINCNESLGHGVTRFSWSEADKNARAWLTKELHSIGLETWTDGIGNLHALYKGSTDAPHVITGSHLDTVYHGGRYDGTYGVVASLEALRSFHEEGFVPKCDIEFIAFAEEEGSNFGNTCLGSKAICGQIDEKGLKALCNKTGNAWDILQAFGLKPENLPSEQINSQDAKAFLEVHIEQNSVLEEAHIPIGIVTDISGMRLHRIHLRGVSDHAASPMQNRKDPMACFAEIAYRIENLWKENVLPKDFSCTIGKIICEPNVGIIIPHEISFTIDIRHVKLDELEQGLRHIEELLKKVTKERNISFSIEQLSASGGVSMDSKLQSCIERVAKSNNIEYMHLKSGPAHDAAAMGQRVPVALIFVPSIGGVSHCPQENTSPTSLVQGALILKETLRDLCIA